MIYTLPEVATVIHQVAKRYRLAPAAILGKARYRSISWPRQEAYYLVHTCGLNLSAIGRAFNKDRASVRHGIAAHKYRMKGINNG